MRKFSEWMDENVSGMRVPLKDADRQDIWGLVHEMKPDLTAKLKQTIEEFLRGVDRGFGREHQNVAVSQILLDLTREYDPHQ
jgi:hypothetical protein